MRFQMNRMVMKGMVMKRMVMKGMVMIGMVTYIVSLRSSWGHILGFSILHQPQKEVCECSTQAQNPNDLINSDFAMLEARNGLAPALALAPAPIIERALMVPGLYFWMT